MLYFSLTVCVFTPSSSLPALDGARESSNGDTNGPPYRLSRLPALSLDHDVRRELKPLADGDRGPLGDSGSSLNLRVRVFRGGNSSSALSAGVWFWYSDWPLGAFRSDGAVPGRPVAVKEREDGCLVAVCGLWACWSAMFKRSPLPLLSRTCGTSWRAGGEESSMVVVLWKGVSDGRDDESTGKCWASSVAAGAVACSRLCCQSEWRVVRV